ncbi:fimbrillin family protein [Parabacteroides leei]|uniref:fimbrillin family protein n=1 Tax=Parabacteroides leei TaxID=2939491 RepID=UPI00189B0864|nr:MULTISPECIES: fimbrillin family protein [Parabacteroides]MCL3852205.1 fimbrillin family protein [Parabacteroides leei]
MRLNYLVVKPFLLAAVALLAACHDDDKPGTGHEGEGQLLVTVGNPGGQALTLRIFGEGMKEPLESRFDAAGTTGALDTWLPVGEYRALVFPTAQKEITVSGTDRFESATVSLNIPEGSSALPALSEPVYAAVSSGITISAEEAMTLTLAPKDIRKILRLTVTAPDGLISGPVEATLNGVAREVNLATGEPVSTATLGLSLPAPGAKQTSGVLAGILGIAWPRENESAAVTDGHLLTLTWQAADGTKQTYSEDVSEQLFKPSQSGADTLDLTVNASARVPIRLYTGIRTRTLIDEFQQTPVCIAVGTSAGQYTENWDAIANEEEITLTPERYYPVDGSPVFLRGYHPVAPLTNGEVKYTLTGQEDLMLSVEQSGSLANRFSAVKTPLTYSHLLSQLNFTLRLKGVPNTYHVRSVHLNGMAATAVVNLFSGKVEPVGMAGPVVVYADPGTGGFPVVDGVVTLPGYVLVQPEASLMLDLVLAVDNNPANDLTFKDLPVQFGEGGATGGSAYEVEISLEVPDTPKPNPDPDPTPDPDDPVAPDVPGPGPDPDPPTPPEPDATDGVKVTVTAKVIDWNKGDGGNVGV